MAQGQSQQSRPMMTIQESVVTCLRKYAVFSGRATRAEYWWWFLATVIAGSILAVVDEFINALTGTEFSPLAGIFWLAILLPGLAVTCRRLHDTGRSGWWQLAWYVIGIVAIVPIIVGVVIGLPTGDDGGDDWWEAVSWAPVVVGIVIGFLIWLAVFIWWLVWLVRQGQAGPNQYGPDPRSWDGEAAIQ